MDNVAGMVELVDMQVLGACEEIRVGSNPATRIRVKRSLFASLMNVNYACVNFARTPPISLGQLCCEQSEGANLMTYYRFESQISFWVRFTLVDLSRYILN